MWNKIKNEANEIMTNIFWICIISFIILTSMPALVLSFGFSWYIAVAFSIIVTFMYFYCKMKIRKWIRG